MLIASVAVLGLLSVLLSRLGVRWWFERASMPGRARGPDGIMIGAEPLDFPHNGGRGLLLLHGFGDTPQTMHELAAQLHARGYGVVVPLLPGHGRTLRQFVQSGSREWLAHASSALATLRTLHPQIGIVGLSMGGALATILAAEHADVRTLVLIAPYLSVPSRVRRLTGWRGAIGAVIPYFPALGSGSIHDDKTRVDNLAYGALDANTLSELVAVVDRGARALPSLTIPVLMLQSREDNRIPAAAAESTFERIGSSDKQLTWLAGCGHILTVDHERDRVASETVAWLERTMPVVQSQARG